MSIFVKATMAPVPRTKESANVSTVFAAILVIMAVAQLFTFEEFIPYIQSLQLPLNDQLEYLVGPLIIFSEVFAVPFLLRMYLSPAFRYISMFLGWLAVVLWLLISLWTVITHPQVDTVGFLGTVVDLTPGLWAVFISLALSVLAAWSGWSLWLGKRSEV